MSAELGLMEIYAISFRVRSQDKPENTSFSVNTSHFITCYFTHPTKEYNICKNKKIIEYSKIVLWFCKKKSIFKTFCLLEMLLMRHHNSFVFSSNNKKQLHVQTDTQLVRFFVPLKKI